MGQNAALVLAAAVCLEHVTRPASRPEPAAPPADYAADNERESPMDFNSNNFLDALLWMFMFIIFIAFIFVWVRCVMDLFSDHSVGGFAKTLWIICFIFFAPLTALVYLIARGKGMEERQMREVADAHVAQAEYIKGVAAQSSTPAEQIKHAKDLLDSGAISQAEFDTLKARALA